MGIYYKGREVGEGWSSGNEYVVSMSGCCKNTLYYFTKFIEVHGRGKIDILHDGGKKGL